MKTVILFGGEGTRLKEHTEIIPKALVEVGGKPILWHIMKIYNAYGITDFILCLGYKGDKIRNYFLENRYRNNDFYIQGDKIEMCTNNEEKWRIMFVNTGENSNKAQRLMNVKKYIKNDDLCISIPNKIYK